MYQPLPKHRKRHALQERTKRTLANLRVTMLMLATMFLARPKRARPLVLLEPLAARQDRARVLTLQQDILYHLVVNRVRLHAALVTIRHLPVKHPVMLLMQATMFLAQPKRARLLVLPEPTTRAPVHPVYQPAQMPMLDITFHPPAKPARPLVL